MLTPYRPVYILAILTVLAVTLIGAWSGKDLNRTSVHKDNIESALFSPPLTISPSWVSLPIDHMSINSTRMFQNRYWISTEFYSPGGPVLVHDVGEIDAESSATRFLGRPSSYLRHYLKEFRGIGIIWEHRYYGKSLPYAINESTPLEHFHYLNLNQSLADLPYFAWNFTHLSLSGVDLTPASTPWIMIGCSYSGLRAAFTRSRYQETIYATYAASAPVQLQVNLDRFFEPIYGKLVNRGFSSCAQDLHAAMRFLDLQLSTPDKAISVKRRVLGPGAEVNSNGDFTLAIANIYSYFQSYGLSDGEHSLTSLCDYMEEQLIPGSSGEQVGLHTRYGDHAAFERLMSWPDLIEIVNSHFKTNCSLSALHDKSNCNLSPSVLDKSGLSWDWQACSELGLFATQNSGQHSLVSRYQSLEYRKSLCTRQFPLARERGFIPEVPDAEALNAESGGRLMRPSNVFWTAGEYDPWRAQTPLASSDVDSRQPYSAISSQQIPMCGTSTAEDRVFGYVLTDAQHCLDFSPTSTEALKARQLFANALRQWLPCFKGQVRPQSFLPYS